MATAFGRYALTLQQSSCLTIQTQKEETIGGKKQLSGTPAHSSAVLPNSALTPYRNASCMNKSYFMVTLRLHGGKSIITWKIKKLEKNRRQ